MLETLKVKAILLSNVSFKTEEGTTHLDEGTEILVDPETNIGQHLRHHFDVSEKEYKIAYLN